MKPGVAARVAAASALGRVLRGGAWSNVVVDTVAEGMTPQDRRLVRRLVYRTLRNLHRIDSTLADHITRGLDATHRDVLDVLRIGAAELISGGGAGHAAVDSAVEAVREIGHPQAAGFVNGVLRNLLRRGAEAGPEPLSDAERHNLPQWVVDDLIAQLGADSAAAFLAASEEDAPRTARVRPGATRQGEATALSDVVLVPPGDLAPGLIIQDVASAAVVAALGDLAGTTVLDVAAAPGGKTLQIWDAQPELVVACDAHPRRVRRARVRLGELGYPGPWVQADGRSLPFAPGTFDRVLVDAPCSGLGTLRRRPELRYKINEQEVTRLAALQHKMLSEAQRVLAPGGRIVYSVCTVTSAETGGVAAEFDGRSPDLPLGTAGEHGRLLTPHRDGVDGMFISVVGN